MLVEVLLRVERRAVDPRQLRVALVAAPVRAREAGELERLDRRRVLEVRAAAEVGEVALRVERDRAVGVLRELDLVRLTLGLEAGDRVLARELLARPARGPPRSRGASPPRSPRGRSPRSARGTRSRSRSRPRSAARSRSSRPGGGAGPPRRAGARSSGGGQRARPGRRVARRQELDPLAVGEREAQVAGLVRSRARAPPARASFGPIARAASSPEAPSGSSSSEASGRTTFMAREDREAGSGRELRASCVPEHHAHKTTRVAGQALA